MTDAHGLPTIDGPVLQCVMFADCLYRPAVARFESYSLPGHMIQIMVSGRIWQEEDGRSHELGPGIAIWYHNNELVRSHILETPWVYYAVSFLAPTLSPPPYESRVSHVGPEAVDCFERLLVAWRDMSVAPMVRHMRVHARLLDLLTHLVPLEGLSFRMDPTTKLWWDLESQIRADLSRPLDLHAIQKLTRRSLRTIIRSCHAAVGMPPMQRVRQMRLSMARGLVLYSDLRFSEIARRVGYGRVQEFSRDYRREFRRTPTEDRHKGPDYLLGRTHPDRVLPPV